MKSREAFDRDPRQGIICGTQAHGPEPFGRTHGTDRLEGRSFNADKEDGPVHSSLEHKYVALYLFLDIIRVVRITAHSALTLFGNMLQQAPLLMTHRLGDGYAGRECPHAHEQNSRRGTRYLINRLCKAEVDGPAARSSSFPPLQSTH